MYTVASSKQVLQFPHKSEGILFKPYCSACLDTERTLTNSKLHITRGTLQRDLTVLNLLNMESTMYPLLLCFR